jgi:hypothetical protein
MYENYIIDVNETHLLIISASMMFSKMGVSDVNFVFARAFSRVSEISPFFEIHDSWALVWFV